MKKIFAWLVVMAMLCSLAVPALAAGPATEEEWYDADRWDSLEEYLSQGGNCMTLIVGPKASATGYPIVGHNEDDGGRNIVRHGWVEPKSDWPDDYKIPGNLSSDATSVPQVEETLGFFWSQSKYASGGAGSACGMLNEAGVFVASNSNSSSKGLAGSYTDGGVWWNIRRSIAERATSARHGAQIAADLSTNWGYNQSARAYTITDNKEGWQVQLSNGQVYVALRVPENHVAVMSNHMNIKHLDYYAQFWPEGTPQSDYILFPSNIETLAGDWYDPAVQTDGLDYSWTFQANGTIKSAGNTYRSLAAMSMLLDKTTKTPVWTGTDPDRTTLVLPTVPVPSGTTRPPEPWGEYEYPFSIEVPAGSVSVEDIYNIMVQHYEGWSSSDNTNWDATRSGPGGTPNSGGTRRICTDTTDECDIVEWTEDVQFTTLWVAFGRSCELPLVPLHPLAGYGVLDGLDNLAPNGGDERFEVENHYVGDPKADLYFGEGSDGWAWQQFRDFQHLYDMCYSDLADAFVPVRTNYFRENYAANQALIKAGDLEAVEAFDQKALDDALELMENFKSNHMNIAEVSADSLDITNGTGSIGHTVQLKLPAGLTPANVFFKWGGRGGFTAGSNLTQLGGGVWEATLNLNRSYTAFAGEYDITVGGRTTSGEGWAGILVLDAASTTYTQLIYEVAPEDQEGVIGRVPVDTSSGGKAAWRALGYEATVRANNATGQIIAESGRARQDGFLQKDGYELLGWKSDIPGDTKIYKAGDTITLSQASRVTLTAVWVEEDQTAFAVTYNAGGAEGTPPVDATAYALDGTGEATVLPVGDLKKGDAEFEGWKDQYGKLYQPGEKFAVNGNYTLTAQWAEEAGDGLYSVTYAVIADEFDIKGDLPTDNNKYNPGDTVTVKAPVDGFEKFDHTFDYWVNPKNPEKPLFPDDTFIMGEEDVTLVAHFYYCGCDTPEPITYKANGATGNVPLDLVEYIPGSNVMLLGKGDLVKGDETFLGWTVRRTGFNDVDAYGFILDGNGERKLFQPGDSVQMKGTGLTAIAQWSGGPGPDDKIPGESDEDLLLTTEAHLVKAGDYFTLNTSFAAQQDSNAATLIFTFDGEKFEYANFTPATGARILRTEYDKGMAKIMVMSEKYDLENLGDIMLRAKEDAQLVREYQTVRLEAEYVLNTVPKTIEKASAAASFTTAGNGSGPYVSGDTDGDGEVTLIDVSNIIDWFGTDSSHAEWETWYVFFDFNNSGNIDIADIAHVAYLVK